MFGRSRVVLVETSICRSRGSFRPVPARVVGVGFDGGRRPDLAGAGRVDARSGNAGSADGERSAHALHCSSVKGASEGPERRSAVQPKEATARTPIRARAQVGSSLGPKPATCRQARGRWRLDDREVVRRLPEAKVATPASGRSRSRTSAGFSHGARRRVSGERAFTTGARERTSVVEADLKHLGVASKESRKAPRGAHRQATGRRTAWTGPKSFTSRKGATARGGREASASP